MIRAFATMLFVLLASLPARAIEIQEITSPGGIKAWLAQDSSIPFAAMTMLFKGGASLDAPEKRGAINLMTATLEEGAGDLNATEFAEALEGLGAEIGFSAGDDALTITFRALSENRDQAADLLRQALTETRFDSDRVELVRAQVQLSIRGEETDPQSIAAKEMARQAWGDHPYGSSTSGTADSVAALTRDDLVDARNRVIARDRMIVAVSGDITPEDLGALLDRTFGALPETGTAPLPQPAKLGLTGGVTVIDWDSPQTVVGFAGPGLPMDDPDYFAAFVANHILGGGGFSSRLMDEIREKRGLTYGVSTGLANGLYGDSWQGGMSSSNDRVAEAVDLVRQEWARLAEGVTDQEVNDAKTYLTGEYPLRFDGNRRIAGILAGMQLVGLPADYVNTRNDKVEAVTSADVQRVAQRLLKADDLRFVLVGRPLGFDADGQRVREPSDDAAAVKDNTASEAAREPETVQ